MNISAPDQQFEEEKTEQEFLKSFSKKLRHYDSLFSYNYPQKIEPQQLINWSDYNLSLIHI